jgi:hypothetical protein
MVTKRFSVKKAQKRGLEVFYCDTDSIHVSGKLPSSWVGKKIGDLKYEPSGGTSTPTRGRMLR